MGASRVVNPAGAVIFFAFTALVSLIPSGCNIERPSLPPEESITVPGEGTVLVYVEVPRRTAGPILSTFTQQSGIEVRAVYRENVGDAFFLQLKQEAAAGRVDVFWGESPLSAMELAEAGLSVPFRPARARPIPSQYRDPEYRWIGFAVNPRVILYNNELVKREDAPQSIWDMARNPWGGRGAMAVIARGAPAFHAATVTAIWGQEEARAFFEEVRGNGTRLVEDDSAVRRLVSSGEALWGILALDEAICANREAEPVHIFFPDRFSLGAVVVPHVAVLLRDAPNLPQAKGLYDYLFAPETGWQLGQDDCALVTLLPGVPRPKWVPSLAVFNVTQLDNRAVFEAFRSNADYFRKWGTLDLSMRPGLLPDH
jgi:iron(III) transport system substrate-binding protein